MKRKFINSDENIIDNNNILKNENKIINDFIKSDIYNEKININYFDNIINYGKKKFIIIMILIIMLLLLII